MIIIQVKEEESIDRALKRYKRKHRNIGVMKEFEKKKAIYQTFCKEKGMKLLTQSTDW